MSYQRTFHRFYVVLTLLWVFWCLCWPFYARKLDVEAASKEVKETYQVCLQEQGVSSEDCLKDRDLNLKLSRQLIAPRGANAYQSFVGGGTAVIAGTILGLCIVPPLLLYPVIRGMVAVSVWIIRRFQSSARESIPV